MGVERAADGAPRKRALADGAGRHPQSRRRQDEAGALHASDGANLNQRFSFALLHFLLAFTHYIHYTPTMPTSHFHYVYILWDATTHTHFYVGHTSDLAARLKTHNAGHVPHTSKFAPWEIHSAIAVQTEEQASELEKYFKSHSGREWVIKHLGLPMGMTSHS